MVETMEVDGRRVHIDITKVGKRWTWAIRLESGYSERNQDSTCETYAAAFDEARSAACMASAR